MAVAKIKAIRSRNGIKNSTKYVKNEQKTTTTVKESEMTANEAKAEEAALPSNPEEKGTSIDAAVKYAVNPDKTKDEEVRLVSGYNCNPLTAAEEMEFLTEYWKKERRMEDNDKDAYHLIQSFDPKDNDHLTYQMAHDIGLEMCREIEKIHDKKLDEERHYKMLVCTHTDREHIHNHIVFCPYDIDTGYKYHDNLITYRQIRAANDKLCKEHNLSIVMDPDDDRKRSYAEEMEKQASNSWKDNIRKDIEAMKSVCNDWDTFVSYMEAAGYTVKQGKYVTYIDAEGNHVRDKTLGREWTKEQINNYWQEMNKEEKPVEPEAEYFEPDKVNTKTKKPYKVKVFDGKGRRRSTLELIILLAIDIIKNEDTSSALDNRIYARKDYKLNRMMETLAAIQSENITSVQEIDSRLKEVGTRISQLKKEFKKTTASLNKMDKINEAIEGYMKVKSLVEKIDALEDGPAKEAIIAEHQKEIAEYKKHKSVLYRARCVTPEQIADFHTRYEHMKESITSINGRLKEESAEYVKYKRLQNSVEAAQNKEYLYNSMEPEEVVQKPRDISKDR